MFLVIKDVIKRHNNKIVLNKVSLQMYSRGILGVLGSSGSGKTTLLNIIAGFDRIQNGSITINGQVISSAKYHAPPNLRNLGYVNQVPTLWPHMTVHENISFPLEVASVSKVCIKKKVYELLEKINLVHLLNRLPSELSIGEQQRIALLRGIVGKPNLLLLDEPLSALDSTTKNEMIVFIDYIFREFDIAAIYVSHDIDEILWLANYLTICVDNKLTPLSSIEDFFYKPKSITEAIFNTSGLILEAKIVQIISSELLLMDFEEYKFYVNKCKNFEVSIDKSYCVFIKYNDIIISKTLSCNNLQHSLECIVISCNLNSKGYILILRSNKKEIKVICSTRYDTGEKVNFIITVGIIVPG